MSQEISLPAIDVGEGTRRAMQAIEAYLARHPHAADSEAGIVQWWLPEMGVDVPLIEARLALQMLARDGRVQSQSLPDGTLIWHAAPVRA